MQVHIDGRIVHGLRTIPSVLPHWALEAKFEGRWLKVCMHIALLLAFNKTPFQDYKLHRISSRSTVKIALSFVTITCK